MACGFVSFPCGGGVGGLKPHFDHCALGIFLMFSATEVGAAINLNGTVAASNVGRTSVAQNPVLNSMFIVLWT